jgi:transcriptional regulator with XRE-family HTH domain
VRKREAPHQASAALGAELAAYRRAAGRTQAQLAQLTEYSRSTIANVETGRQHVPRSFWERTDAALRTGGILASAHDELEAAARRDLRAAARHVSTARQAQAWHDDLDPIPRAPAQPRAGGDATPARRHLGSWQPDELSVLVDGEQPKELIDVTVPQEAEPRRVTPGDVVRLRGMRARLKAIDNAHGGRGRAAHGHLVPAP